MGAIHWWRADPGTANHSLPNRPLAELQAYNTRFVILSINIGIFFVKYKISCDAHLTTTGNNCCGTNLTKAYLVVNLGYFVRFALFTYVSFHLVCTVGTTSEEGVVFAYGVFNQSVSMLECLLYTVAIFKQHALKILFKYIPFYHNQDRRAMLSQVRLQNHTCINNCKTNSTR